MTKDADFVRRKERALAIMAEKKMWRSNYAPPLYRLLWKLGVNIPPPPFAFFWTNLFSFAAMYTLFWGTMMWFICWKPRGTSVTSAIITSLLAGLIFGVSMALFHHWRKKANNLPEWDRL